MRKYLKRYSAHVRLLSYCLMTNHVHHFFFACVEAMSRFMKGLHQEYAQGFNQARGRSGPLFESRFWSRPIASDDDLGKTIRYIDQNPVVAGLTEDIALYAWGSAGAYLHGWNTMPLGRPEMEWLLGPKMATGVDFSAAYRSCFGTPFSQQGYLDLTERHRKEAVRAKSELERQDYGSAGYHDEMEALARSADGMEVLRERMLLPTEVEEYLAESAEREILGRIVVGNKNSSITGLELLRLALLRDVCELTHKEICEIMGMSAGVLWRRLERHRVWMAKGGEYADRVELVLTDLLENGWNRVHGVRPFFSG